VVQADGLRQLNGTTWPSPGSDAKDFFHAGNHPEWSGTTGPDNQWNDGKPTGLRIFEIGALGDSLSFYVGDAKPVSLGQPFSKAKNPGIAPWAQGWIQGWTSAGNAPTPLFYGVRQGNGARGASSSNGSHEWARDGLLRDGLLRDGLGRQ
jgi:hypothetical protein